MGTVTVLGYVSVTYSPVSGRKPLCARRHSLTRTCCSCIGWWADGSADLGSLASMSGQQPPVYWSRRAWSKPSGRAWECVAESKSRGSPIIESLSKL